MPPTLSLEQKLKCLSPKEKERFLQYGPMAFPCYDDSPDALRYSVFMYVWQIATKKPLFKYEQKQELFKCLLEAIAQGDGTVFREIAEAIEVVVEGEKTKGRLPVHLAVYKAAMEERRTGDASQISPSAILMSVGRDPNNEGSQRQLRRAVKQVGMNLDPNPSGRPRKFRKKKE